MKTLAILIFIACIYPSCSVNNKSDAYGTFEATEITISSEVTGKITCFSIEEGQSLQNGDLVGKIDTVDYYLKLELLETQKKAVASKFENIKAQIDFQLQQKMNLESDKERLEKLRKDDAVPQKQLDDIISNIKLADKQIASTKTQNLNVQSEIRSIDKQMEQVKETLEKCKIINPVNGIVIGKYTHANEFTVTGKPMYKIACLDSMYLRVYVSGSQLPSLKPGLKVEVITDRNEKEINKTNGIITWISPNAEFTPKIIQTKEERVNLVYAVKVLVKNDGTIKIGMPGEVNFTSASE